MPGLDTPGTWVREPANGPVGRSKKRTAVSDSPNTPAAAPPHRKVLRLYRGKPLLVTSAVNSGQ